jgi:hypothetical protein
MKKFVVTLFLIISVISISSGQFTKIGGGLAFTSGFPFHEQTWDANKSGKIGLFVNSIYEISVPIHISSSLTLFYPHITNDATEKTVVSSMMFDINGHYVFNSLDQFEFYGLAGLDILLAKKKNVYESSGTFKESDNALGLNLGIGTYMKITEQFDFCAEAKYVFNSKYNQFMLNAGILVNIDWLKKHEDSGL